MVNGINIQNVFERELDESKVSKVSISTFNCRNNCIYIDNIIYIIL